MLEPEHLKSTENFNITPRITGTDHKKTTNTD